jgi:molybdopterin-guanine dinucleotide biosynthesis protein A
MGRDKALLPIGQTILIQHVAAEVAAAAGVVRAVGGDYGHLGLEVVADLFPGFGPAGRICALSSGLPKGRRLSHWTPPAVYMGSVPSTIRARLRLWNERCGKASIL